jgi:hypothetical protein
LPFEAAAAIVRAMKTVSNKTHKPLSVPLPRGKILHLGPGKTGQIASNAADHPAVKKLVEAGQIEILDQDPQLGDGVGSGKAGRPWTAGHASASASRRSGDR